MSIKKRSITKGCLITAAVAVILPPLFPVLHINALAPLLVYIIYRQPLINTLWIALIGGFTLDLLGAHNILGLYALVACTVTWGLSSLRRHFFEDKPSTLPLLTFIASASFTLLSSILCRACGETAVMNLTWCITDLALYSLIDAAYGFAVFVLLDRKDKAEAAVG
jgi:rod shape-determining protein MreD